MYEEVQKRSKLLVFLIKSIKKAILTTIFSPC